jgi:hypothetical protein
LYFIITRKTPRRPTFTVEYLPTVNTIISFQPFFPHGRINLTWIAHSLLTNHNSPNLTTLKKPYTIFSNFSKKGGKITLSPHSVKQICVVKQPVGDVKKQLGQDVASISKWYLEAYQRINDVIVKNQILVASFIGYLGFSGPPTR